MQKVSARNVPEDGDASQKPAGRASATEAQGENKQASKLPSSDNEDADIPSDEYVEKAILEHWRRLQLLGSPNHSWKDADKLDAGDVPVNCQHMGPRLDIGYPDRATFQRAGHIEVMLERFLRPAADPATFEQKSTSITTVLKKYLKERCNWLSRQRLDYVFHTSEHHGMPGISLRQCRRFQAGAADFDGEGDAW